MSSPSQIHILVEDKRQEMFIRRFLLRRGFDKRKMVFSPVPEGRGSGKQWVHANFANQVRVCRQRNSRASTSMFAMMDADELTVARCLSDLDNELVQSTQKPLDKIHDPIARLIPKWSVETWILYLSSIGASEPSISEDIPYKGSKTEEQWNELIPQASATLDAWSKSSAALPANLIDSLRRGLQEIPRALPAGR
jgi:hypothetical protein